jgi:hypothetical protein
MSCTSSHTPLADHNIGITGYKSGKHIYGYLSTIYQCKCCATTFSVVPLMMIWSVIYPHYDGYYSQWCWPHHARPGMGRQHCQRGVACSTIPGKEKVACGTVPQKGMMYVMHCWDISSLLHERCMVDMAIENVRKHTTQFDPDRPVIVI